MTASRIMTKPAWPNGTKIYGKWHHNRYQIISYIGHGTQGDVYLAQSDSGHVAIKFPRENPALSMEMNVLKHLKKVQGMRRGPSLFEVDDWVADGKVQPFYVMDYIHGDSFRSFVKTKGFQWACVLMAQMLGELHLLHEAGWVFGDLKPDNLMIEQPHAYLRWLDPGGITKINRAVREYSALYDRGYWKLGTRKADRSYDIFAVAIILIEASNGHHLEKRNQGNPAWLFSIIKKNHLLAPYHMVLEKALNGRYESALVMKKELLHLLNETNLQSKRKNISPNLSRVNRKRKKRFKKTLFVLLFILILGGAILGYLWLI